MLHLLKCYFVNKYFLCACVIIFFFFVSTQLRWHRYISKM